MPTAEIITIGTELLLGEIQDTNTRYLARLLRDCGIDLYRTMTVGDNEKRISQALQEALLRSNIIITTGGLGPTVDDPTRQAIALALGVELEFQPHLWEQILDRFKRYGRAPGENNKRQAFIPHGAIPVENPVGTAPAFIFEKGDRSVIALPGVPREMEYLTVNVVLPYLRDHFHLREVIKARVLHTASIGESQVDELVGDLELLSNPTVGLLAHPGQVDIRVTAKAPSFEEAERMISEVIDKINQADATRISIDIPSGLFCDSNSANPRKHIVKSHYTLAFELPKFSFLFPVFIIPQVLKAPLYLIVRLDKIFIQSEFISEF